MEQLVAWITRMDPNNVPFMVIFFMTMIFCGALLWFKVWPFVENKWWPAIVERDKQKLEIEREQNSLLQSLRDVAMSLKDTVSGLATAFNHHSAESRDAINAVQDKLLLLSPKVGEVSK